MSKRLLSLLLAFVMLFSLLPDAVLAAEDGELPEQKLEDTELMPENDPDELPGEPEEGDPEQPEEPEQSEAPEEPEEIGLPEVPEVPEVIEQPEEPEEPEEPEKIDPDKPEKIDPDMPEKIDPDKAEADGADLAIVLSGSCGENVSFELNSSGVLTISGTGPMTDYSYNSFPWYGKRNNVKKVIVGEGVTSIGSSAFYNCSSLTSVSIPSTVTSIGSSAFYNCCNLTSASIPEGVTSIGSSAFAYCSNLTSVSIPEGVTRIGSGAFFNCSSLTDITLPESITGIGDKAFYGCGLTDITLPDSVTSVGEWAFCGCWRLTGIAIPEGVTSISDYAFRGCSSLTGITLPDSVTGIGEEAFSNCSSLTGITLPDSVTDIGSSAFSGCSSLTGITLPDSVTGIGSRAFSGCSSLTSIALPEGVTGIGDAVFSGCSSLTDVSLPEGLTSIGYAVFYNCSSLTDITLPDSVTSIGGSAFYGCSSLTSIALPEGVTSVGEWAFYNCSSLTGIALPDSVTDIGKNAFYNCSSLTSIALPEGVISISDKAFYGCSSLTDVTLPEGVTDIGEYAFYNCSSLTSVSIPASMETIGYGAFSSSGLRDVFYGGTRAQWNDINIGNPNEELLNATLHCKPEILTQPTSIAVVEGKTATFLVSAADAESYQWHYRSSPDGDWESLSIPGSNTDTLAFDVTAAQDGCQYRCEVMGEAGSVYSDTAALTVLVKPKITTQPAGINVVPGTTVTFKVVAAGGDLHYQWYMREAGGTLKALSAASAKKDTLKVVTKLEHDGRQYCCKVWNAAGSTYTKTVTLEVKDVKPKITTQPSNFNVIAGTSVTYHVKASGSHLKYQWYMREAGGTLKALSAVSAKTDTLKVVTKPAHDGRQYCCKVYNSAGSTYTKTVTLHVEIAKPVIITQPQDDTCLAGNYVTFSVAAIGGNLKYQWYWKDSSGTMTALTGDSAKTSTLKVFAATSHSYHGRQYCCKVYNSAGSTMTASASLSVARNPKYRALCVGNENYSPVLPGCLNDMNTMAGMLSGLANSFEVSTLPDASAGEILNAISYAYAGATEDDVSLFSYSGHGLNDGGGSYMGALVGTDGSYLTTSRLANALSAVPGRVIVLLDSCHSGALIGRDGEVTQATAADLDAFNQSVISAFAACDSTIVFEQSELMLDEESGEPVPKSGELNGRTKFIVITAASMSETSSSIHGSNGWYGLFTRAFVEGCGSGYPGGSYTGSIPCDSNGDSQISVSEIYYYVKSITGNKQHAQCYAADMSEVMFMR